MLVIIKKTPFAYSSTVLVYGNIFILLIILTAWGLFVEWVMASGNIPYQCKHCKNNCVNPFQVLTNRAKCFPRMDCSEILFSLINKNTNKLVASEKKNYFDCKLSIIRPVSFLGICSVHNMTSAVS